MNSPRLRLGDALMRARRELGLTQAELSEQAGVPQPRISGSENGKSVPIDQLKKLCEFLNVEFDLSGLDSQRAFCANPHCLGALPFVMRTRVLVRPTFYVLKSEKKAFCQLCGFDRPLQTACDCGEPTAVGVSCPSCGSVYVKESVVDSPEPEAVENALRKLAMRNLKFFPEAGFPEPLAHGEDLAQVSTALINENDR